MNYIFNKLTEAFIFLLLTGSISSLTAGTIVVNNQLVEAKIYRICRIELPMEKN